MKATIASTTCLWVALGAISAHAETVDVKYRGLVDLAPFACQDITRSSVIHRVCYDATESYMLIELGETYYHYCEIDKTTVDGLLAAESIGQFYNQNIKGHGARYDDRDQLFRRIATSHSD